MLYLQALDNIREDPVATYLELIIQDRYTYPHQLRYLAVWAAANSHIRQQDKVNIPF
jgi:hypothetical protein